MATKPDRSLTLEVQESDRAVIVRIRGSVEISDAEAVQARLEELAKRKTPVIVLDLSGMSFICSSGLGAIIVGHLKMRKHEGQLRVVNPQPAIRELLETTRLNKLFPPYNSVEQALEC
ncbi:MAG: STAS domain-containing protein [Planctomycetota bacterium]|jgi:anti-anti-sigma factor